MPMQMWILGLDGPPPALLISALVKSIRLRRQEEAIKWVTLLWPIRELRARLTRRVFLSSAEDSISPALMVEVGRWLHSHRRYDLNAVATKVSRICTMRPTLSAHTLVALLAALGRELRQNPSRLEEEK